MSDPLDDHVETFGSLSPQEYHQWRSRSELFNVIEINWFADLLLRLIPGGFLILGAELGFGLSFFSKSGQTQRW
jgi:hypothetical protein